MKGLSSLLEKMRGEKLDARRINEINHERFLGVRLTEHLPMKESGSFVWDFANPYKLWALMLSESASFAKLFKETVDRHGCDLNVAIGFDEYTPGNPLKLNNARKCMVLSFTFVEMRKQWQGCCWITPIVIRSKILKETVGGWGDAFRRFVRVLLLGETGLLTRGWAFEVEGQPFVVHARLAIVVADCDGHRMAWDMKGASGIRPCLLHPNVVKAHSGIVEHDDSFVEITCSEHGRFQEASTSDIHNDFDLLAAAHVRLAARRMTRKRYDNLEKSLGLNYAPAGVFSDRELRAAFDFRSALCMDWVHCVLQSGILAIEVDLLMDAVGDNIARDLQLYLKGEWCFASATAKKAKKLWVLFDERKLMHQEKFKATASDLLTLYTILRHFVQTRLRSNPELDTQVASFEAACAIVDVILKAKRGLMPLPQAATLLRSALEDHFAKHQAVYTDAHFVPKHHYLWDVASQWERQDDVFDAFVVERLHLRVKAVSEHIRNTARFELTAVSSVINCQARDLAEAKFEDTLIGMTAPLDGTVV